MTMISLDEFETLSPVRILQLVFLGFSLFLAVFLILLIFLPPDVFPAPAVVPDNSAGSAGTIPVTRTFSFLNQTETVSVAVDRSVYLGSKKTHRDLFLFGDQRRAGARYYGAMINDPTQEQIYTDLIAEFRKIRAERNLTDDEYLELIASCIQAIPYKDGGNLPPKYPAELLVDGMGDCDDKSILISGLLAREGYTVVLFKFGPEGHMAMGIGSDAFPYKATGYTFLEGMTPAYVGAPTIHLNIPLNSDPLVIPVQNGTKVYRSGSETQYITRAEADAKVKAEELTQRLEGFAPNDRNSTEYRELERERDRYVAARLYILSHPYDRPGTYEYVQWKLRDIPAGTGG